MLDLQKLSIRRLLETADSDLYSKISPKYFSGSNLLLYGKIENFYRNNLRVPSIEELLVVRKELSLQDYLESQILVDDNKNDKIQNEFLIAQLQDFCVREETIGFIDGILDDLDELEQVEIIDKFQNHLLELNKAIPMGKELINVALLETVPSADTFVMYPSGLSNEYDGINGGFALQELVMIGGRRGSGKSILALNASLNRFLQGHTVGFFSIEMRYLEVYYRTLSILTEIPFLNYMRNMLTTTEILKTAKVRMDTFYEPSSFINDCLKELEKTSDVKLFDNKIRAEEPKMKDNRLFIIDDPSLTPNRIDHYCNVFSNKYKNFTMATIDYLNIISVDDSKDWKAQITVAETLKTLSRKYNLTALSPYQVDATLEARFAKGILDAADRAFTFTPKGPDDDDADVLTMYTAKIRNGKNMTFNIGMNWECVKVDPSRNTSAISANSKLMKGAQYGTGTKEGAKDI